MGVDEALEFYEAHEEWRKEKERNQIYGRKLANIDLSRHFEYFSFFGLIHFLILFIGFSCAMNKDVLEQGFCYLLILCPLCFVFFVEFVEKVSSRVGFFF